VGAPEVIANPHADGVGQAAASAHPERARSQVVRSGGDAGTWEAIPARPYEHADGTSTAVTRRLLAGGPGSGCAFEVRYFELAPGGRTSHERHRHEHAVVVLRGAGEVTLGGIVHPLAPGDLVRVVADDPHQFRNAGEEPFGFLCIVDAERDRSVPLDDGDAPSCGLEPPG
jgi:quercetin dioxygenase-like cupin family protein